MFQMPFDHRSCITTVEICFQNSVFNYSYINTDYIVHIHMLCVC